MNIEHRLITKIVKTKNFREVKKLGIKANMLRAYDARTVFKFIEEYYGNRAHYGRVPSRTLVKKNFPSFEFVKSSETIEELCEILRTEYLKHVISTDLEETYGVLDSEGPYKALSALRNKLSKAQVALPKNRDIVLAESADELIKEYELAMNAKDNLLGVPWPWEQLNYETQGMHPEDFILIYARAKSMKTWVAIKIATHAYEVGNRRVMFYSCEMPATKVRVRVACTLCGVDYDKLRKGKLDPKERKRYFRRMKQLADEEKENETKTFKRSFLITTDASDPAGGGIDNVIAKAEQFEPHLIIIDSFYRMRDCSSGQRSYKWGTQGNIIRDIKSAAQKLQIPIIGVTQKNRSEVDDTKEGMTDISFTDIAAHEVDLALKAVKGDIDINGRVNINMQVAGAREMRPDGFKLHVIPSTNWDWGGWIDRSQMKEERVKRRSKSVGGVKVKLVEDLPDEDDSLEEEK